MKQSAILDGVEAEMRPGVITQHGFLGHDSRNLGDILIEDDARVQRLGVTHALIAARMRKLTEMGARGLGEEIAVVPHYEVRVDAVRGKLPCPFGDPGLHQKTNTSVTNMTTGESLTYTDLGVHMIEAHGFYEGLGGAFRLDPQKLVSALDVPQASE